ncbi:UNVERIFIED_CONTAM: hypothetical protein Slati_4254800 [Sesamum latifolium]|uniref:Retrotransposon gag domain-containing protein n=1 Tax=Sesamum latifolium TaxID=2727402 RepID=A0AAW2TBY0_9LAMI
MKLGFIDSTNVKPADTDPSFEHWIRVDSMVTTWIHNSISKEIVEGFMYTKSARKLWMDLEQRFGGCNGPQLYQLQRSITSLNQGNSTVGHYFTSLVKLWEEFDVLTPKTQCTCNGCTCGASKAAADLASFMQVIQFLMGLGDNFDHVRNQLLVMDPTPNVNRAYSMVLSVEKQREVHLELTETGDATAMHIRGVFKKDERRRGYNDKRSQFCDKCNKSGHSRDTCLI